MIEPDFANQPLMPWTRSEFKSKLDVFVIYCQQVKNGLHPPPFWWPVGGVDTWPIPFMLGDSWYIFDLIRLGWEDLVAPTLSAIPVVIGEQLSLAWQGLKDFLSPQSTASSEDAALAIEAGAATNWGGPVWADASGGSQ